MRAWLLAVLLACGTTPLAEPCEMCEQGQHGENVWCPVHQTGFVFGKPTECQQCFGAALGASRCPIH